jgi:DNA (cytosine-5)-methyltransferase 1
MTDRKFKVVSLFSGAMGLDIGLEKTERFKIIACVEMKKAFCDTIRTNKNAGCLPGLQKIYETDIKELDPYTLMKDLNLNQGDLDLLVGGPPCQSFSTAGKRGTIQDPRGTLLWDFLKVVEALQPRFFLMENVRGLLSAALKHRPIAERPNKGGPPLSPEEEPGSVVRLFAKDLQKIPGGPYHMDCFEVNAVNYGAPQLRERVLFVGNRYNTIVDFPEPTHGVFRSPKKQRSLFEKKTKLKPWKTLKDAIANINDKNPIVMDFSPRKLKYLNLIPEGSNWRSLPEKIQKESMGKAWYAKGGRSGWWRRLSFDLPCPTLLTHPNHASTSLCHPLEVRALTVKEYAMIQEFPNNWEFVGTPLEMYTQIGNAVPVRLGMVAGDSIAKYLDQLSESDWKIGEDKPDSFRVVYVQSHVRTRQWYKNGTVYKWKDGQKNGEVKYGPSKTKSKARAI